MAIGFGPPVAGGVLRTRADQTRRDKKTDLTRARKKNLPRAKKNNQKKGKKRMNQQKPEALCIFFIISYKYRHNFLPLTKINI